MVDLFDFWAECSPGDFTHPRDRYVLDRVAHGFDLRCLPACFTGPLRTAPVVLLYLSPGFDKADVEEAGTEAGRARYAAQRAGWARLPGPENCAPHWTWWEARTRLYGSWKHLRDRLAILNISPYHSVSFTHEHVLAALPSCRVTLDWAQAVLFPAAERGERVVVCMRSARFWGFGRERRHGASLFAPAVTRGGHMLTEGENGAIRQEIVRAVRGAVGSASH